jgi:hypothetical protein
MFIQHPAIVHPQHPMQTQSVLVFFNLSKDMLYSEVEKQRKSGNENINKLRLAFL